LHLKFNINRTRVVILTMICVTASWVVFESRPVQRAPAAVPRPNISAVTGVSTWVDNPVSLRGEEAIKHLKQRGSCQSPAEAMAGAGYAINRVDHTPMLARFIFRQPTPDTVNAVRTTSAQEDGSERTSAPQQMKAEEARKYLKQTGEGQSLMAALTAARFGLKWQGHAPFGGESGSGYLGMSHNQNLNAWFDEEGATIRPTVPEKERAQAWQLGLRLKAYGYGARMQAAPPIVSRQVKVSRIEYRRSNFEFRNANFEFEKASIFQLAIGNQKSAITEWYENRAEGIEQGFTIEARPVRSVEVGANEPLQMLLGVSGDLRARVKDDGQQIELVDKQGKGALSYSKLVAQDADGKPLAARMEASADGREIALVVEDAGARYPLVIDPIVASLEQKLDAGTHREVDARFGFAVAIDGDRAVVGAWREDGFQAVDAGDVYIFSRSGNIWSRVDSLGGSAANDNCGYSVAISGSRVVFGCPGANSNTGRAFIDDPVAVRFNELIPPSGARNAGDRYGASVAISGNKVVVGAPFNDNVGVDEGLIHIFQINSDGTVPPGSFDGGFFGPNSQFGTSVSIDGNTLVVGAPGVGAGYANVYPVSPISIGLGQPTTLQPNDGVTGDLFGSSVALSGNTVVIGAPLNGQKGTNAGAAYVFVRDPSGNWSQQQKLTGSDSTANDFFGASHIAIQGNTIVVGAYSWEATNLNDDTAEEGAAYIFTRSGTVWTQQAQIFADDPQRGDQFGIDVGISGDSVIVGARGATASGVQRAGAAYVYRLSCVPPYDTNATINISANGYSNYTTCPGSALSFGANYRSPTAPPNFQWRKNGINIPGAISGTYTIANVSASDAGSYDVFVYTSCGGEFSSPATLTVHTFSINPPSGNFGASGSTGIVNVTATGASCGWTAVSNSSFITVTSGASGTGNGTVGFTVAANSGPARTGTITIAGKTFSISQDGTLVSNVQFNASSYNVGEGAGFAAITVTRTGDTSGTATVDFATSDLGAQQRTDYTITAGTLAFAPGDTSKTFSVLIVNDVYVEGDETLNLTLSTPTGGAVLGSPSSATLTITDNDSSSSTTNPLDDAHFFVQQHYYDFLSRYPDQGGWDFWTGQITQCGSDVTCIRNKRIDVSNAYFYELEYQQTGAYVFRLYRAAFGNNQPFPNMDNSNQTEAKKLPSYAVFAFDRARVVGGASLAAGQQSLANAFTQRSEFLTKYPASQDGPTFVDAVLATIKNELGVDLTSQRTALINLFNSGGRGAVLYRLADDNVSTNPINNRAFIDEEYNRAFVATQYFGYLRRDPDIGGFLFWLGQVNSAPLRDTTKQHAMVCAFITSLEYQQRFSSVVTHGNADCPQ
jgi:hypothetical protein